MKFNLLLFILISLQAVAVEVVAEKPYATCEEVQLFKALKVYKDPNLFLPNLALIDSDPRRGWEALFSETPLLTTLHGVVQIMRLGDAREFKNFGAVAELYALVDKRFRFLDTPESAKRRKAVLIIPVKICAGEGYADSLGFVLESDLKEATIEERFAGQMPPSTLKNPIPSFKKHKEAGDLPASTQ